MTIVDTRVVNQLIEYVYQLGVPNMDKLVRDGRVGLEERLALENVILTGDVADLDFFREQLLTAEVLPESGTWNMGSDEWLHEEYNAFWSWFSRNWPAHSQGIITSGVCIC